MSANSMIEWTDHTFNPWEGCQKVGPGCDNCYAEARNAHSGGTAINWGPGAPRRRTSPSNWRLPTRWNAQAAEFLAQHGRRQRVFCASLADVFDNAVNDEWRDDLATLISVTPDLDWLLLTKRVGNAGEMLGRMFLDGPPPNVRIGATIVNQAEADGDIPKLLRLRLPNFLSMEPLLAAVDLREWLECTGMPDCTRCDGQKLDWVIAGGESGPGARPMHPDWARGLRDQCAAASVPFLFKQWGEHDLSYDRDRDDPDYRRCDAMSRVPGRWINLAGGHGFNGERVHYARYVGKKAAGRLLDGVTHDGAPA